MNSTLIVNFRLTSVTTEFGSKILRPLHINSCFLRDGIGSGASRRATVWGINVRHFCIRYTNMILRDAFGNKFSSQEIFFSLLCAAWSRKYVSLILTYALSYLTFGRTRMNVWVSLKKLGSCSPSPFPEHPRVIR